METKLSGHGKSITELVRKKEVIEALRWGAGEWDKKAINLNLAHACKLCYIFADTCDDCPLSIKQDSPEGNDCANLPRYFNAKYHLRNDELARKECSILAGVMRWEAYKLENDNHE